MLPEIETTRDFKISTARSIAILFVGIVMTIIEIMINEEVVRTLLVSFKHF